MLYDTKYDQTTPTGNLLNKAADLIEKHGHAKQILKDKQGHMCFMGALFEANDGFWAGDPAIEAALQATDRILGLSTEQSSFGTLVSAVVDWNNAYQRTSEEVIAVMRAAAVIANKEKINAA